MNDQPEYQLERTSEKGKIIMIYVCIAIICAIIMTCFLYLGKYSRGVVEKNVATGSAVNVEIQNLSMEEQVGMYDIMELKKDFNATDQNGEAVNLHSLRGKVWVFAQFYGSCPECNKINFQILKDIYSKHEGNPDFKIVTMSVMKSDDGVAAMKNMADALKVKSDNWLFLTADVNAVNEFCSTNMLYAKFKENTDKEGSGMEGAIFHDMGMAVFNANMIMKAKVDVYSQIKAKNELGAEIKKKQLGLEVAAALKQLKEFKK